MKQKELDTVLLARWRDQPRYRARLRRVVQHVLAALAVGEDIETFAQNRASFWYKVFFFTPHGALKCDTCGELWDKEDFARYVVHDLNLRRVSVNAVMNNWQSGILWEDARPIAALLLRTWREYEASHTSMDTRPQA